MTHHESSTKLYLGIFTALLVLTGTTVAAAEVELGDWNIVLAMVIAGTKALLVLWVFMHLRQAPPLTRFFMVAAVFWLVILFTLIFTDYLTRPWLPGSAGW